MYVFSIAIEKLTSISITFLLICQIKMTSAGCSGKNTQRKFRQETKGCCGVEGKVQYHDPRRS
jgi:hypothetical protein